MTPKLRSTNYTAGDIGGFQGVSIRRRRMKMRLTVASKSPCKQGGGSSADALG